MTLKMSYREKLMSKGMTIKQLNKKYGNYYLDLSKVNMFELGCSNHEHITLCNQERNKCEHLYIVRSVSSEIRENYNQISTWINQFGYK